MPPSKVVSTPRLAKAALFRVTVFDPTISVPGMVEASVGGAVAEGQISRRQDSGPRLADDISLDKPGPPSVEPSPMRTLPPPTIAPLTLSVP